MPIPFSDGARSRNGKLQGLGTWLVSVGFFCSERHRLHLQYLNHPSHTLRRRQNEYLKNFICGQIFKNYLSLALKKFCAARFCLKTVRMTFFMPVLYKLNVNVVTNSKFLTLATAFFLESMVCWARALKATSVQLIWNSNWTHLWARSSKICIKNFPRPLPLTSWTNWIS